MDRAWRGEGRGILVSSARNFRIRTPGVEKTSAWARHSDPGTCDLQNLGERPSRPLSCPVPHAVQPASMAEGRSVKSVKDVPADKFIAAFAAYLKQTNKVRG